METEKKNRKTLLASQIEEDLLRYIKETPVEIGTKISNEFELAEMFQVGRSTIRESVKTLVTKGVLEVRRGDGAYVCSHNPVEDDPLGISRLHDKYKLALELCDVRLMLEPEIVARAAENITDEEILELRRLCDETEALYLAGEDHMEKDVAFHTHIARCSRNRVVENLIPMIVNSIRTFVNITQRHLKYETIFTHRAITEAVADHDVKGAQYAMVMHLTYNRQKIIELMKEHEALQSGKMSDASDLQNPEDHRTDEGA